jgi:hypothetical protein
MKQLSQPFVQISDLSGVPLASGLLYIGTANLNPETNPQVVYWDSAGTQPAAQPIVLTNGHISRDGKIADLFVQNDFSITVRTKKGVLIFSKLSVSNNNALAGGVAGAVVYQSAPDTTAFTGAGVANQLLASTGAGAPAWTSTPQVTTAARSDNSASAASTAFVRSVGPANSKILTISTGVQLALAVGDVGAFVDSGYLGGVSSAMLPSAASVPAGMGFEFSCPNLLPFAIQVIVNSATPTDQISVNGTLLSLAYVGQGKNLKLISDGTGAWKLSVSSKFEYSQISPGFTLTLLTGPMTFSHSLPTTPANATMGIVCQFAELGYSVGDRIPSPLNVAGALTIPTPVAINATSITITPGSAIWYIVPKTGGTPQPVNNFNWSFYVTCE